MSSATRPARAAESYDAVPYEGHPIQDTSPDALAVMGTLFGIEPAPVENCRVLELGCGSSVNLAAMALPLPGARFVGIDASPRQIEIGRELLRRIGVSNVELEARDLLELPADLGPFDYVLCHGVYSWVAPPVQEKILEILGRSLTPRGIAYLSYNTYPGCHLRDMAREMMRFHVRHVPDPTESTKQARALIAFLIRFGNDPRAEYGKILENVQKELSAEPDWYVFHEYLEEYNSPVYFSELVERAERRGLQYLAPSVFHARELNLPAEVSEVLAKLGSRVVREQYLDFLFNRKFRKTLFCPSGVNVAAEPRAEAVRSMTVVSRAQSSAAAPEGSPPGVREFVAPTGERIATDRPLVQSVLSLLEERAPLPVPVSEIWPEVLRRIPVEEDGAASPEEIDRVLVRLQTAHLAELRTWSPMQPFAAGERPVASPLARLQASGNLPVTNLRHESRNLLDFDRLVLPLLDGTRDRAALRQAVAREVAEDRMHFEDSSGVRLEDPARVGEFVAREVEQSLQRIAGGCLLTG
ncbi:MAG TPA: methyltransferase regulatory domain-containing protein [Thermoanaerobaculia bacterium]